MTKIKNISDINYLSIYSYSDFIGSNFLKDMYDNKGVIYMIYNVKNNKYYIGQSTKLNRRWLGHIQDSKNVNSKSYLLPLQKDIRFFGKDCFRFLILDLVNISEIYLKEMYYIYFYNSNNRSFGYNNLENKLSYSNYLTLIEDLKNISISKKELAKNYKLSIQTINAINRGTSFYNNDLDYPIRKQEKEYKYFYCSCGKQKTTKNTKSCLDCYNKHKQRNIAPKEQLLDMLLHFPFTTVGFYYGVSDNSIRKWCRFHNMSTSCKDYKNNK